MDLKAQDLKSNIDSLLLSAFNAYISMDYYASYTEADEALALAQQAKYKEGVIRATIYRAKVLQEFGLSAESIDLLLETYKQYRSHYSASLLTEHIVCWAEHMGN